MTRINVGINPKDLIREHLIAEHREIKRIPNMIVSGKAIIKNIPNEFTLGEGHVKFFYNKLNYLLKRYRLLYKECKKRNYKVQNYENAWNNIPKELMNNWKPKDKDINLIRKRLEEKLNKK
ncbi:Pyrimidine dimer DNA glycosylase [sediment metagenome]|uniref:Pyrimidine dimer DNA glycosylase n=1 Tax=sediment metagenome TaxID=749907 RepID=D9PM99_9ZZZZ